MLRIGYRASSVSREGINADMLCSSRNTDRLQAKSGTREGDLETPWVLSAVVAKGI